MREDIGGRTRVAGIIGWPLEHTLSPAIHNAAFAAAGLDWVYAAFPVAPGTPAADVVAGIRALGIQGMNVTMPLKQSVAPHLDGVAEDARRLGAVNTIVCQAGKLIGTNTDGPGFLRFLERDAGVIPEGRRVLLLGAGGSARALAGALAAAGARVTVGARRADQAREVLAVAAAGEAVAWTPEAIAYAAAESDLVVNCTPARGAELPLDHGALGPRHVVVDLIYWPPPTPLVEEARAAGATAFSGLGMLLHQAALSFELWTGVPAPLEVMSAAAVAALGGARP
jgi:shikimate dehydrogenase